LRVRVGVIQQSARRKLQLWNFFHRQKSSNNFVATAMSLYHEAAGILDTVNKGKTSLKAEIFGKKTWKTDGKTLFALTSEAAKWSSILAEVVEKSGILKLEKVRSPAYLQANRDVCQYVSELTSNPSS